MDHSCEALALNRTGYYYSLTSEVHEPLLAAPSKRTRDPQTSLARPRLTSQAATSPQQAAGMTGKHTEALHALKPAWAGLLAVSEPLVPDLGSLIFCK